MTEYQILVKTGGNKNRWLLYAKKRICTRTSEIISTPKNAKKNYNNVEFFFFFFHHICEFGEYWRIDKRARKKNPRCLAVFTRIRAQTETIFYSREMIASN